MGLINDLATLIGAGMSVDDVKALAELEKGKSNDSKNQSTDESEDKEVKTDGQGEETPGEEQVEEKEDKTTEELESLRKDLEESKKLIAELQDANRKRNRDDGSIKSDEDLLNDIMLDMY